MKLMEKLRRKSKKNNKSESNGYHAAHPGKSRVNQNGEKGYWSLCGQWRTDYPCSYYQKPKCPDCLNILELMKANDEAGRQSIKHRIM